MLVTLPMSSCHGQLPSLQMVDNALLLSILQYDLQPFASNHVHTQTSRGILETQSMQTWCSTRTQSCHMPAPQAVMWMIAISIYYACVACSNSPFVVSNHIAAPEAGK